MTVAVDDTGAAADQLPPPEPAIDPLAPWWRRAAALAVDVLPAVTVLTALELVRLAVSPDSGWRWACVAVEAAAILLTAANRVLLPTITGWSLGRAVTGVTVQRRDGTPVGPGRLLLRELAHLLDTVSVFVGWLWPLWDQQNRTFADMLTRTEVRRIDPRRLPRNLAVLTAAVFAAAAVLTVAAAAVSYLLVYQRDRGIDTARTQVAAQGPKAVEQMLSYDPQSLADDFARAQSLATEHYRTQLVDQQQVVQKGKLSPNQYWVVNSSLLSATPNRATMLLFMQGQRGDKGKERFISATVRAVFAKSGAQWLVDDLIPVTEPLPAEDGN